MRFHHRFSPLHPAASLHDFQLLTVSEIVTVVDKLLDKQSATDPLPTRLLKDNADILAPFLAELINRCLLSGSVPRQFKVACIMPRLKKTDLDPADPKSYRPIANLSVLSKLLQRLVAQQLVAYLNSP